MNRKQLIFLLVAVIVIGSAGLILLRRKSESWSQGESKMGAKVLPRFQPNDVAAIHIKGPVEVTLLHQNDLWRVQERYGYPANFHEISDVLIKLRDLKVTEADPVDPSDLGRINLNQPGQDGGGMLVEFKDAQGKLLDSLLVGKKHQRAAGDSHASFMASEPDGCYVLLPDDPKEALLISDALSALQPSPEAWLSRDFIAVDDPQSIALASTHAGASWKIFRETESGPWTLEHAGSNETVNAAWAKQITETIRSPRFVDVVPADKAAHTGLDRPMVVTIETFGHFVYTLKIGAKTPRGNYFLTAAVTGQPGDNQKLQDKLKQEQTLAPWVYLIGSWIMDPLLRDRAQVLEGYREDAGNPAPAPSEPKPGNTLPGDQTWKPHVIQ